MGLSFVPITIGSLTGVQRADAGVASGLMNTSRQIGGAIGLAAATAIAEASTNRYVDAHHAVSATSRLALDHGFQTALYGLTGLIVVGAVLVATLMESPPTSASSGRRADERVALEEAA
jgi:hypothetical protein